jgi:cobalt-precorrin 5A hydrolase/precorrin-3B C17-methyltransferase
VAARAAAGNVVRSDEPEPPLIFVSDRTVEVPRPAVVYRPPSLVAGVGCSRGASAGEILGLLRASLAEAGLSEGSVAALASIEAKRDEAGLLRPRRAWGYRCASTLPKGWRP